MRISDWSSDVCSSDLFLLADALERRADTLITTGGVQSNHVRQTAAAAARAGLACELVLTRVVPWGGADYERSGHIQLDRLFGRSDERRVGKEGVSTCRSSGAR